MSRFRAFVLAALLALAPALAYAQAQGPDWLLPISPPGGGSGGTAGAGLTLTGSVFTLGDGLGVTYTSPGQLGLIGGIVTASAPPLVMTQTWNNGSVAFNGITLTITDTASSGTSLLMNLQDPGHGAFSVRKDGLVTVTGTGLSASALLANGAGQVASLASGLFSITGVVQTSGFTVATLPAVGAGKRAYVTDQTTACPSPGGALTGGGAVTCPVFSTASAWVGD